MKDYSFLHTSHSDKSGGDVIGMSSWILKHFIVKGEENLHNYVWFITLFNGKIINYASYMLLD